MLYSGITVYGTETSIVDELFPFPFNYCEAGDEKKKQLAQKSEGDKSTWNDFCGLVQL